MKIKIYLTALAAILFATQACKDDRKEDQPSATANYVVGVTTSVTPRTSYLFSSQNMPSGTVTTSNALESTSSALMYRYGKYVFQNNDQAPATLKRYAFDASGKPQEQGSFAIPGLRTIGAVLFVSDTEAYATAAQFGSTPKLVQFNPSTMQVTKDIALPGVQKAGATEMYYMGLMQRDNHIFMGINYQDANFQNLEDKVFVAIIDRTTGSLVKMISDSRSSQMWNGGSIQSFAPNCMVKEANGDIYVMGYAANGKPSGVVRIKNGETEFDQSYFFDLSAAAGGHCLGLFAPANGFTFTVKYTRDAAYPFDSGDPAGQYFRINLPAKTVSGAIAGSLPLVRGNRAFMTRWDEEKIYFNVSGSTENAVYAYTMANGGVAKAFDLSTGYCTAFSKITP